MREIPVPFTSDDQIRKVVKYEAEHHLHDCDADDVVVQYTSVGESIEGTNLLVFAAKKVDISRRVDSCRTAGCEPLAIDLDAAAYYNAVRATGQVDEVAACVLLNIGHKSTELIFVQDGEIRAVRSVRMGVDSIVTGLARDMDIEFDAASSKVSELSGDSDGGDLFLPDLDGDDKRETEKSHAELERDLFQTKRDDFIVRLRREYVRSSAATRGARPEKVIATGPGLRITGLIDLLGKRLGLEVDPFRPSEAFNAKLGDTLPEVFDAGAAVAIGLALKGRGDDTIGIDFRQEELKVANKFELLKTTLAVSVTLAFLSLMAASFYFVHKRETLMRDRYEMLLTDAAKVFSQRAAAYNQLGENVVKQRERVNAGDIENAPPRADAIRRFVRELRRMRSRLQRKSGDPKGLPQIQSAVRTWNDVFAIIAKNHKEIGYVDFEAIKITQEAFSMTVITSDTRAVEFIKEQVTKAPSLKGMLEPDKYGITNADNGRVRCTLEWTVPRRGRRG